MPLVSDQESRASRGIFLTTLRKKRDHIGRSQKTCKASYSVDILTQTLVSIVLQSPCRDPTPHPPTISSAWKLLQRRGRWTKPETSSNMFLSNFSTLLFLHRPWLIVYFSSLVVENLGSRSTIWPLFSYDRSTHLVIYEMTVRAASYRILPECTESGWPAL